MRDITATLVDLAVRGYLQIEERKAKKLLGLRTSHDYLFTIRKPADTWKELQPHEQSLLDGLFAGGIRHSVESSTLEHSFYTRLPGIRKEIFKRLLERRYYTQRPDMVRRRYIGLGFLVGLVVLLGGLGLSAVLGQAPVPVIVAGTLSAAITAAFGWVMPCRTLLGTRALEGVLGFEEFLTRVEGDHLRRAVKTPEMFEKYLPYAMALGVEKSWAKAFEGICRQPPDWYQGGTPRTFHPRSFVSDLGQMSEQTAGAMASSPRSSEGSGFGGGGGGGGGGSSGGGMGGGGGGGF
jgi:uncharacterized membrane protein YgcG